jgi:hypothetical protein
MRLVFLRHLLRITLASLILACAVESAPAQDTPATARITRWKAMQVRLMQRGAQRRATRYAAQAAALKAAKGRKGADATAGAARRPARQEPPDPQRLGVQEMESAQSATATTALAPNRIVNNRSTDTATCPSAPCTGLPWSGQCEVSIAANGSNLVATWNDGEGFVSGPSTQGYAYSNNGGVTWVDGGIPPTTNVGTWTSDPVVIANTSNGDFWYCALCEPSGTTNGIGLVKGTFVAGVLTWQTPEVVISGSNSSVIYDKEWLAVDPANSNLYVIYSRFTVSGGNITTNWIEMRRKVAPLFTWSAVAQLSAGVDNGRVQGPRVGVGPNSYVWTTWNTIGSSVLDYLKVRQSTNTGTSWLAEVQAASEYTNFGTGAPGFNRGSGFAFPGFAIDRSGGVHNGRAYLTWNESLNFYDDNFPAVPPVKNETESNDTPGTADAFNMGDELNGTISTSTDLDYWSFSGTAGQTVICEFDGTGAPSLDPSFRLFCSDGSTRLAYAEPGQASYGLIVFTLPTTATYTLRVAPFAGTGAYVIRTVFAAAGAERGRDHRDVFTSYSDNGTTWSTPVRVNGDAARYDNWLPEVAVGGDGNVFVAWYDWRDAPDNSCAGRSMVYLSRSSDGGVSWPDGSPVSDTLSAWTTAYSNIAPNQGDYISLFANATTAFVCWSDGRRGDPDVFMSAVPLGFTPIQVAVSNTHVEPGLVRIEWFSPDGPSFSATVYRRTDGGDWTDLGQVTPDGTGRIVFEDRDVAAATRYHYRLGIREGAEETFAGEVVVDVPGRVELAIEEVRPNPSDRQMWVSVTLPGSGPATLQLIDVGGRLVRDLSVAGPGRRTVDLAAGPRLTPGVYVIRLSQAGVSMVRRVSVVR